MSRFPIYLILVLMIGGLWSCFDHRIPSITPGLPPTRLRVKTIILDLPDNRAKVSSFRYDGQGRLSSILTYQTPDSSVSEIEYSNYQYDDQNRLTGLRHEAVLYPRGSRSNLVEGYTYTYNAAGQVTSISNYPGFIVGSTYNSDNQLVSASRSFGTSGLSISGSDSFTFTGNNLTAYQTCFGVAFKGSPLSPCSGFNSTFTHDDKLNPFYGVFVIPAPFPNGFINLTFGPGRAVTYFGGTDNVLNLSQNNVLTETSTSVSVAYQYQYNAAKLPTVRIRTTTSPTPNSTVSTETLRFEYESY